MKALAIVSFLVLLNFPIISSAQWEWQNPLPQGNSLGDVYAFDEQYCWAVGNSGTIIFTENGGNTWVFQESGTWESLFNIQFIDQFTGWIVGHGGTILYSENAGNTWQDYSINTDIDLNGLHFIDQYNGWIVGEEGTILYTQDGGVGWEYQDCGCDNNFREVFFTDELNGWIVGGHAIYNTTDGGANWELQYYNEYENPSDIFFADPDIGWIANAATNNGFVYHTSNGGQNWYSQGSLSATIVGISFSNSYNGWAVGSRIDGSGWSGYIFNTTDGGLNWSNQWTGWDGVILNGVHATNSGPVWAVGGGGLMLKKESGTSWAELSEAFDKNTRYYSVFFVDQDNGWLVGGGESYFYEDWERIRHTSDGGLTWEMQHSANGHNHQILNDIFFIDEYKGWAVGKSGAIRHTADGGATDWEIQSGSSNYHLNDVFFSNSLKGWIVGENGTIIHTEDGGNNWNGQSISVNNNLNSTYFIDDSCGWVVGDDGIILYTENGGLFYENQASGIDANLQSVVFVNDKKGWIAGEKTLLYTYDGGDTWAPDTSLALGSPITLHEIIFIDSLHGWIAGEGIYQGIIYHTNDGGENWVEQNSHCARSLYSIYCIDTVNGWAVGTTGTIIHTNNGGYANIYDPPKPTFQSQDCIVYPNPCASVAHLRLMINDQFLGSWNRHLICDLYSISGRKIRRIVEQEVMPGEHEIEIDVSDLPAGIYYIQIHAGGKIGGVKIVVMK